MANSFQSDKFESSIGAKSRILKIGYNLFGFIGN
jgi:hypothetical protein